jgi:small GTP-binding protein
MATMDNLIEEFPEPVADMVQQIWAALPLARQQELEGTLSLLPSSLKPLKDILSFVVDRYKPVFGTKHDIAIVGPANVGKSTLYNQLISRKEDVAEVGPVPGTTRDNQEADAGLFLLIDTPGADAVGAVGERERQIAFQAAEGADFLVIVFEATRGIKRHDKELFDALMALEKPFVVVLNKIDLIPKPEREQVLEAAARNLRLEPSQIIETVATKGTNVERLILAVVKFEPELLAAIAEALPHYQAKLAWQQTVAAASSAGIVGFIPLPIADLVPLFLIQAGLVLSIARVYGFKITLGRAKELIAALGVGLIARTVFYELAKLGGVPGWALAAAIAASTTVGIGYAAMMWFGFGEKPTRDSLRKNTADVARYLRGQLLGMGKKKPDRGTLRQRISQALHDLPSHLRPGSGVHEMEDAAGLADTARLADGAGEVGTAR